MQAEKKKDKAQQSATLKQHLSWGGQNPEIPVKLKQF